MNLSNTLDYEQKNLLIGLFNLVDGINQLIILLFFALIIFLIVKTIRKKVISVQPFDVPDIMVKDGINGSVIAKKIVDNMYFITRFKRIRQKMVRTYREISPVSLEIDIPTMTLDQPDFEIPGTGIKFSSMIGLIRQFLNKAPLTISGDISIKNHYLHIFARLQGRHDFPFKPIFSHNYHHDLDKACLFIAKSALMINYTQHVALFQYHTKDRNILTTINFMINHGSDKESSFAYTLLGLKYYDERQYTEATSSFRRAMKINPDNYYAVNGLGACLIEKKKYKIGIEILKLALIKNIRFASSYTNWGYALYKMEEEDLIHSPSPYKNAIEKYELAIAYDSSYIQAYLNWGFVLFQLGNYSGAMEKMKKVIEIDPENIDAYYNWGVTLERMNRNELAIKKYQKVIELDPMGYNGYAARINIDRLRGNIL